MRRPANKQTGERNPVTIQTHDRNKDISFTKGN